MKYKHDTHVEVDISSVRDTVLSALARLAAASAEAEACYVSALEVARAQEARSLELRAARDLARL